MSVKYFIIGLVVGVSFCLGYTVGSYDNRHKGDHDPVLYRTSISTATVTLPKPYHIEWPKYWEGEFVRMERIPIMLCEDKSETWEPRDNGACYQEDAPSNRLQHISK